MNGKQVVVIFKVTLICHLELNLWLQLKKLERKQVRLIIEQATYGEDLFSMQKEMLQLIPDEKALENYIKYFLIN